MIAFITIGSVALALLVLSFLFDGVLDAFDFDFGADGVFSTSAVLGFFAAFGFGGWLSLGAISDSIGIAVAVGAVAGAIIGIISGLLMRFVKNAETGSVERTNMIGKVGSALYASEVGDPFPFSILYRGQREKISAIADTEVTSGQQLRVDTIISSTQVKVSPVETQAPIHTTTEKESN